MEETDARHTLFRLGHNAWPLALLVLSILLLQIHGIAFWTAQTGWSGVLWSLLLDGAGLWLWSRRSLSYRLLAVVASVLTLVGPLYQVGYAPLQVAWTTQRALAAAPGTRAALTEQRDNLEAERERLTTSLATYEANSEARSGWLPAIESTSQRLAETNRQLRQVTDQLAGIAPDGIGLFSGLFVLLLQMVSLVLFQVIGVISVLVLAGASRREEAPPTEVSVPTPPVPAAQGTGHADPVESVQAHLARYLQASKQTQTGFARVHGLSSKEMSFLANHARRIEAGEKTVSLRFVERLETLLSQLENA